MAVRMRTGRLTTKTTDPKTGARVADPAVYGKEVDGGKVSSWPEVRTMYQQGKLNETMKGRRNVPSEVMNYLQGKTDVLNDKEFEEPIISRTSNSSGKTYTDLNATLRPGGSRYAAMEKSFKGVGFEKPGPGMKVQYDMAEIPLSGSNKMQAQSMVTDLNVYRKDPEKSEKKIETPVKLEKMPTKAAFSSTKGNVKQLKPKADLPKFNAPTSATKMGHKNAMGTKGANYDDIKRAKAGVVKNTTAGYNRERKQFEAYAGAGGDQTKSMFKAEAKQSRQIGAQYRAEGNAEGVEMMRQEAKQYRKAAQFAGKVGKGTNKYFDRNMVSEFRGSKEHAANRNTMDAKIRAAGVKAANNRNTLY